MNLVLLQQAEVAGAIEDGGRVVLAAHDRRARHIVSVLRPRPGASIRVGVVGGGVGSASVQVLDDGRVQLTTAPGGPSFACLPPPPVAPRVELLLAMPRPKVLMRSWSALAQLGVRRVILTNAFRVEKPYFSSQATNPAKYEPELLDGLEQAVCTRMPDVRVEMRLKPFLEDELDQLCPPGMLRLLCHPGDGGLRMAEAVAAAHSRSPRSHGAPGLGVLLAVGPEGGWVDFELELLRRHHFVQVSLGPRVLTTEVALVALVSLAADALRACSASTAGTSTGRAETSAAGPKSSVAPTAGASRCAALAHLAIATAARWRCKLLSLGCSSVQSA
mmetsp:Transcript_73813/g.238561  ORF Transcript_73813/g.238561 Transcript_73813/m.238561 type:complete len:332 (-) Transcript_73813:32-1027(-)